jgi:hypothetical protein
LDCEWLLCVRRDQLLRRHEHLALPLGIDADDVVRGFVNLVRLRAEVRAAVEPLHGRHAVALEFVRSEDSVHGERRRFGGGERRDEQQQTGERTDHVLVSLVRRIVIGVIAMLNRPPTHALSGRSGNVSPESPLFREQETI